MALDQHPHRAVVTRRWILPNDTITSLSKVRAGDICGPEMVSKIADRTEEWESTYALDLYRIIARFDEERRVRKLCAHLSRVTAKKVKSATWQKRFRRRYEDNAEAALVVAEEVLGDITKFERAAKKERGSLARRGTAVDSIGMAKGRASARRSKLRWVLEDAVQDLRKHCEFLKEFVVWSDGLAGGDSVDEGGEVRDYEDEEDEEDAEDTEDMEEEAGNSSKAAAYPPPPARRSSRQSI